MHIPFWLRKNAPQIFTAIAAVTATSSVGFAVSGTIKAVDAVRDMEAQIGQKPTRKEILQEVWPYYLPSGATLGVSLAAMMLSRRAGARQTAAAMSLYSVSNAMLAEWQANVREKLGEAQADEMRDEIARRHIQQNPPNPNAIGGPSIVTRTGYGNTLFRDDMFGDYFYSDWEAVRRGVNNVNTQIINETYATLVDLHQEWHIPFFRGGNDIVWNVGEKIELDEHPPVIEMENGELCHCLIYNLPGQGKRIF